MPKHTVSLESLKIQREEMEKNFLKKVTDLETTLEDRQKENEHLKQTNRNLILSNSAITGALESLSKQSEDKEKKIQELEDKVQVLEEELHKQKLPDSSFSLAQELCDSLSDYSKATSDVTMFVTDHGDGRMAGRNISRREVQSVIKHGGEGILQENGRRRVTYEGKRVILDKTKPVVVTVHKTGAESNTDSLSVQGPPEPQEPDWVQVGPHGKPVQRVSHVAIFGDGSVRAVAKPWKERIAKILQDNGSLKGETTRRLEGLRALEARMSSTEVDQLLEPLTGCHNPSAVLSSRMQKFVKSIAAEWSAEEVETYLGVHGFRGKDANEASRLLHGLPTDKREKVMHEISFFSFLDASNKLSVLKRGIRA